MLLETFFYKYISVSFVTFYISDNCLCLYTELTIMHAIIYQASMTTISNRYISRFKADINKHIESMICDILFSNNLSLGGG